MNGRVLITGAAGALGRSVVARFLEGGDRILAVDANEEALAELTGLAPSDVLSVRRVDLADTAEVERLFAFVPYFLITGYLIFRSGYFPKTIGVLYQIAGVAYLTNSVALILAPQFADRIFAVIAGPALIGEASFCLWLLVKGVNMEKWNRRQLQYRSKAEASI